ncbi:hypothetical protein HPB52_018453 [Rhipicephalus sanguineus]|uniref:DUF7041 domain-containing protein n=1 Tax=Rhipicephalus sanguineus TaxID=34632 RepID=A0A9D4ST00_RHISA|nr:hypothetical protein HPB52_018453 [Rhipicephalus sanguineus]
MKPPAAPDKHPPTLQRCKQSPLSLFGFRKSGMLIRLSGWRKSQFVTARVTAQTSKFHHVVSALSPEIASEIRDLILAPPETNPYDKLSAELLKLTSSSERQRPQELLSAEELGDRNPSQLLRRLQQLLGDKATSFDQNLLRQPASPDRCNHLPVQAEEKSSYDYWSHSGTWRTR